MAKPKKKPVKKVSAGKTTPKKSKVVKEDPFFQSIKSKLKLEESYVSLVLGALVVLFLAAFLVLLIGGKTSKANNAPIKTRIMPVVKMKTQKTYVVQQDETLWDIAVKFYGDGEKEQDIITANHLEDNADDIQPGTKLIIP